MLSKTKLANKKYKHDRKRRLKARVEKMAKLEREARAPKPIRLKKSWLADKGVITRDDIEQAD